MTLGGQPEYFDETFRDIDVRTHSVEGLEFHDCLFEECRFSETKLRGSRFVDCLFQGCDLSLVDPADAVFRNVSMEDSKLIGVNWSLATNLETEPLALDFDGCVLNLSTFMDVNFSGRSITSCVAHDAYFSRTSFNRADCRGTDFRGSDFKHCDLSEADFRGATNYLIDLETNRLAKAKFALPEAMALLASLDIELS